MRSLKLLYYPRYLRNLRFAIAAFRFDESEVLLCRGQNHFDSSLP